MSVVFDEVVGTIAPEPMSSNDREEPSRSEEPQPLSLREELEKLECRMARLRAD